MASNQNTVTRCFSWDRSALSSDSLGQEDNPCRQGKDRPDLRLLSSFVTLMGPNKKKPRKGNIDGGLLKHFIQGCPLSAHPCPPHFTPENIHGRKACCTTLNTDAECNHVYLDLGTAGDFVFLFNNIFPSSLRENGISSPLRRLTWPRGLLWQRATRGSRFPEELWEAVWGSFLWLYQEAFNIPFKTCPGSRALRWVGCESLPVPTNRGQMTSERKETLFA